jgi:hypothetical protein
MILPHRPRCADGDYRLGRRGGLGLGEVCRPMKPADTGRHQKGGKAPHQPTDARGLCLRPPEPVLTNWSILDSARYGHRIIREADSPDQRKVNVGPLATTLLEVTRRLAVLLGIAA